MQLVTSQINDRLPAVSTCFHLMSVSTKSDSAEYYDEQTITNNTKTDRITQKLLGIGQQSDLNLLSLQYLFPSQIVL